LALSSKPTLTMPVTLPPGRLRLGTRPACTGSAPVANTTGIVVDADLAAMADAMLPGTAMTATRRRTKSATNSGSRSLSFCPKRYSIATLRPSTYPVSLKPFWNAAR
jgi:hypothetical protein